MQLKRIKVQVNARTRIKYLAQNTPIGGTRRSEEKEVSSW